MKVSKAVQKLIDKHRAEGNVISDVGFKPFVDDAAQAKLDARDEKHFQAEVIKLAKRCGWRHYHTHDSRRSAAGFPDLVLVRGQRLIFAELKVKPNRPTPAQEEWLADLRRIHGDVVTVLWYPEQWMEIERTLA